MSTFFKLLFNDTYFFCKCLVSIVDWVNALNQSVNLMAGNLQCQFDASV